MTGSTASKKTLLLTNIASFSVSPHQLSVLVLPYDLGSHISVVKKSGGFFVTKKEVTNPK